MLIVDETLLSKRPLRPTTATCLTHEQALDQLRDFALLETRVPGLATALAVVRLTAAGSARAACGFWHLPTVKAAVFVHAALAHSAGLGITRQALVELGLPSAAKNMRSGDFDTAAKSLGVPRFLKQRQPGAWTYATAVEAHAELLRKAGHALTSRMLMQLGGDARLVYDYARNSSGGWTKFIETVAGIYPELPKLDMPRANDGTIFDSQQEVVFYEAARRAFPNEVLKPQVKVLRDGKRPYVVDFVIASKVVVEVLGIDLGETPRGARRMTYRTRLDEKIAYIVNVLDWPLIMIEPSELVDVKRLHAKMSQIGRLLNIVPLLPLSQTGHARYPLGTWQDAEFCQDKLRNLADLHGRWPTINEIGAAGCSGLSNWVRSEGGPKTVAARMGIPYVGNLSIRERSLACRAAALERLVAEQSATNQFPSSSLFKQDIALLGGVSEARRLVGEQLGIEIPLTRKQAGYWEDPVSVLEVWHSFVARTGRVPRLKELVEVAGCTTIITAVMRLGGIYALNRLLATDLPRTRQTREPQVLSALVKQVLQGGRPTHVDALCKAASTPPAEEGMCDVDEVKPVTAWLEAEVKSLQVAEPKLRKPSLFHQLAMVGSTCLAPLAPENEAITRPTYRRLRVS